MRVTFEVAFQALPPSLHRHCTDEAQKAETVLSAVIYIYIYIYIYIRLADSVISLYRVSFKLTTTTTTTTTKTVKECDIFNRMILIGPQQETILKVQSAIDCRIQKTLQTSETKGPRTLEIPGCQIMAEVALIDAKAIINLLFGKTNWKKTQYSSKEKTFKKGKNGFFF